MAAGHVIFNVVTGIAALVILPLMLLSIQWVQDRAGLAGGPATFLALFHTLFNLLGIALLWPFTNRLVSFLKSQFKAAEEDEARPRYLDNTLIGTPSLAHEAMVKELGRIQDISISMAEDAINTEASLSPQLASERFVMDRLVDAVADFTTELRRTDLPQDIAETLPQAMASARYFCDVADLALLIDQAQSGEVSSISEEIDEMLIENRRVAISILHTIREEGGSEETLIREAATLDNLERSYEQVKAKLLRAGTSGKIPVRRMLALIELMKKIERAVNYSSKGQNAFYSFSKTLSPQAGVEAAAVASEMKAAEELPPVTSAMETNPEESSQPDETGTSHSA